MSLDDRVREIRENDIRLSRERADAAQRDRERCEAKMALKEAWEKVTAAIVQSGIQPDVRVATPEGIARGNEVNKNRPKSYYSKPFLPSLLEELFPNTGVKSPGVLHSVPQDLDVAWDRAVSNAIGSLVQPAWDMESYMVLRGGRYSHSHTGHDKDRLFLARDATVYRSGVVYPMRYSKSGYDFYPIDECRELSDDVHNAIETALATLVVRRKLGLQGIQLPSGRPPAT